MCHTALVVAVPTPDDQRRLTNPITASLRVVADRKRDQWVFPRQAAGAVIRFVRDALLIIAGLVGFTVAAFQWSPIAGWAMAGLSALLLDLCIRGDRDDGGP